MCCQDLSARGSLSFVPLPYVCHHGRGGKRSSWGDGYYVQKTGDNPLLLCQSRSRWKCITQHVLQIKQKHRGRCDITRMPSFPTTSQSTLLQDRHCKGPIPFYWSFPKPNTVVFLPNCNRTMTEKLIFSPQEPHVISWETNENVKKSTSNDNGVYSELRPIQWARVQWRVILLRSQPTNGHRWKK